MCNIEKDIIIFAYAGEFSYGLCWWIPKIRKTLRKRLRGYHVIAFDYNGRNGLYRDFVDEFIGYDEEAESKLGWPACGASHTKRGCVLHKEIVDPAALDFINNYTKIHNINPKHMITALNLHDFTPDNHDLSGCRLSFEPNPWGDYVHLNARKHIQDRIIKELEENLDPNSQTIAVMARTRNRLETKDGENWSHDNWNIFVNKLITELDVNVVLLGVPPRDKDGYPGALPFDSIPNRLYSMIRNNSDAVEEQIAVLKQTKASIYGSSGASCLPMFCNTPSFMLNQSEDGWRLKHPWCLKLTDNHKNIKIFDKYPPGDAHYNMPPGEIFDEFKQFYEGL